MNIPVAVYCLTCHILSLVSWKSFQALTKVIVLSKNYALYQGKSGQIHLHQLPSYTNLSFSFVRHPCLKLKPYSPTRFILKPRPSGVDGIRAFSEEQNSGYTESLQKVQYDNRITLLRCCSFPIVLVFYPVQLTQSIKAIQQQYCLFFQNHSTKILGIE